MLTKIAIGRCLKLFKVSHKLSPCVLRHYILRKNNKSSVYKPCDRSARRNEAIVTNGSKKLKEIITHTE